MIRINFNHAWSVNEKKRAFDSFGNDSETVNLPHDYSISLERNKECISGSSTGYFDSYAVIYTKNYVVSKEYEGKNVFLYIDGAYMNSEVYINGNIVAHRPYGYSPYFADLTDFIKFNEENEFKVIVNNTAPNTRWYSGTGLFRNVDLLFSSDVSIAHFGTFVKTESVTDGDATIITEVNVENRTGKKVYPKVEVEILDKDLKSVSKGHFSVAVEPSSSNKGRIRMLIENADIWDLDKPRMYKATVKVILNDEILDEESTPFGIRTISVDVKRGFRLNGKTIKLKGGCIHHDNGILGSAAFDDAEYRKVKIHKENGYNALRSAHNPPSRALLDACDEIGILVMDETFDMWNQSKNTNDYHLFFSKWWKEDVDAMVLRDRNHPSIIMWSIGNEIPEHNNTSYGAIWSQRLADRVRKNDDTRFITSALNNVEPYGEEFVKLTIGEDGGFNFTSKGMLDYNHENFSKITEGYASPLDIVGYNYVDYLYEGQKRDYPHRVMCCHESFPIEMDIQWEKVMNNSHIIGDFTWTSFDYIGEAGLGKVEYFDKNEKNINYQNLFVSPYPWRLSNDSDFDILGFEKPQLHYRKIIWGSDETYIAVLDPKNFDKIEVISKWGWADTEHTWNFENSVGKMTRVEVYSAQDEVELFINEKSFGRKPAGKSNRFKAVFEVEYQEGTVKAVSYKDSKIVSEDMIETTKSSYKIALEKENICKEDGELIFVKVVILDEDEKVVNNAKIPLTATVSGGKLQAFGAADPKSEENYTSGKFTSYRGVALAVIRKEQSEITLEVSGENLKSELIKLS